MKKLLFSCVLLLGASGLSYGMERAIKRNDWESVANILWAAAHDRVKVNELVTVLSHSKTSLNTFYMNGSCLLNELLARAYTRPEEKSHNRIIRGLNVRFALKELIKCGQLEPEKTHSGQLVVEQLDTTAKTLADNHYYKLLQDICTEVYEEKRKSASIFDNYESSVSNGLTRCTITRTPLSFIIDRRVWAALAAVIVLRTAYVLYTRTPEQPDDTKNKPAEEQEDQEQRDDV